jgi:hypothetical protein
MECVFGRRPVRPTSLMSLRIPALAVVAALIAIASVLAASPRATGASGCGSGYTYAGLIGKAPASGVSAQLTVVGAPQVFGGHVAAWVGVGGAGMGAGGEDAWLQVGLSALSDGTSNLYYEVAQAGAKPRAVKLARVVPGRSYHVAIIEVRDRPNVWRVWVDGDALTPPLSLPGSHGKWAPIATAESWDGGTSACNGYHYQFSHLHVSGRAGRGWSAMRSANWFIDPGYRVVGRNVTRFLATRSV